MVLRAACVQSRFTGATQFVSEDVGLDKYVGEKPTGL